jgi:ubiquinone/menaquinone biosynthesis C-methylase UbiE
MFSDPIVNVRNFGFSLGEQVADFGAGTGHYTMAVANQVGEDGRVYCVEVQKGLLDRIRNGATSEGLNNIEYVWGDLEKVGGSKLKEYCVDSVILANILFQVEHKDNLLIETSRVLKPGGRVVFVDWLDSFDGLGPKPEAVITKDMAKNIFTKHKFTLDKEIEVGDHHYSMIFRKNS